MADVVSAEKRSQMMAGIKGKNTKPELLIRKALHHAGFRYRLHDRRLPGKPDLIFPKYGAVLFIHGCFWHGHSCHLFRMPSSRTEFWQAKISRNQATDLQNTKTLFELGWRVGIVWECAIRGRTRQEFETVVESCVSWLLSDRKELIIQGKI